MLTREQILSANDLPTESVDVPEWGGEIIVRTLTGRDRDSYEASLIDAGKGDKLNLTNIKARFCVRCIVDDQGGRIFTDAEADELGNKSAAAISRVFEVAQRLNALTEQAIEELEKNS